MRSRRNTAMLAALVVVLLILTAFRSGEPHDGVYDPYEISSRSGASPGSTVLVNAPSGMFGCITLCPPSGWFWNSSRGGILIYDKQPQDGQQRAAAFSWDVIGEFNGRWYELSDGSTSGVSSYSGSTPMISFVSAPVPQSSITFRYGVRSGYLMTAGIPLSADARRLEVRYDTGQIVQQRFIVSKSGQTGPFGIVARAKAVCELRVFDSNGTLLQQIDSSNDPQLALQIQRNAPGGCQQ